VVALVQGMQAQEICGGLGCGDGPPPQPVDRCCVIVEEGVCALRGWGVVCQDFLVGDGAG